MSRNTTKSYGIPYKDCLVKLCRKPRRPGFVTCPEHSSKEDAFLDWYEQTHNEYWRHLLPILLKELINL